MNTPEQKREQRSGGEWEKIEPETVGHLMTVLDVFAHASEDGHMTQESFKEAQEYIESWVEYRSQFVRDLLLSKQNEIIERLELEKEKTKVPKKPGTQKGFVYGLTEKWVNAVILYAGRFNYNKGLEDAQAIIREVLSK